MAISSLGVGSGLNLSSIITSLMQVEQQPMIALQKKQASVQTRISALGTLSDTLTTLQTAAKGLIPNNAQTASDKFTTFKASSSDSSVATVTAGAGAMASSYMLKNITVATAEQVRKDQSALSIPGSGTGTLSIQVGGGTSVDVSVTGASSLSDIATAINSAKADVTASVINDGTTNHLVISAKNTGASNTISITGSTGWEGFDYNPAAPSGSSNSWVQQRGAASASVDINGLTIQSESNTLGSSTIPDLTINLLKESTAGTTLSVTQDSTSSITAALTSFIKSYNDAVTSMKNLGTYNEATKVGAALQGDSTLRSAKSQVVGFLLTPQGSGAYKTLADLGVSLQKDGTLKIDTGTSGSTSKLAKAIETDFSAVANLVSSVGTAFSAGLEKLVGSSGSISSVQESAKERIKALERQQEALQIRLDRVEARYTKQFSALDTLVSNMNQTSSSLTAMLADLTASTNKN